MNKNKRSRVNNAIHPIEDTETPTVNKKLHIKTEININKFLPRSYIIPDAGMHLYKIGLTNYCIGNNEIKRSLIHNPMLVFIMALIEVLVSIISLCNTNENMDLFYYLGDQSVFIPGIRIHFNIVKVIFYSISPISQILHYWYSRKGISYEWIKPFEMMAGIKTPNEIGINNCFSKLVILFSKFFYYEFNYLLLYLLI